MLVETITAAEVELMEALELLRIQYISLGLINSKIQAAKAVLDSLKKVNQIESVNNGRNSRSKKSSEPELEESDDS